ncbi:NDP-hexose 2,3-dehydratase family protein [Amycolatopsis lurida]
MHSPQAGSLDDVRAWLAERAVHDAPAIHRLPLAELDDWNISPVTGDLRHDSGAFFRIGGLKVDSPDTPVSSWGQPIIHQPEIGILGILVKQIDGVLCLLMQAKMEPGNVNTVQLSPTVQATRSNYRRVHGGSATRHLDYFADLAGGRVLVDVLQSEQCSIFYKKRNRNMIVEVTEDIPIDDSYRWLTLGQVRTLLNENNVVNMNTRSVLSNLPLNALSNEKETRDDTFSAAMLASLADQDYTLEVQNWFNHIKGSAVFVADPVPLKELTDWKRSEMDVSHRSGRFFSVIGISVGSAGREVASWHQPLIAPHGQGVVAFLVSRARGRLEVLVQAKIEAGTRDVAELSPTVQGIPESYGDLPSAARPRFLDLVLSAKPEQIRYDTVLSEEGGRFYHAQHRYMVVEVGADVRDETPPPNYHWATMGQLAELIRHSGYVNIEARTLIAGMHTLW